MINNSLALMIREYPIMGSIENLQRLILLPHVMERLIPKEGNLIINRLWGDAAILGIGLNELLARWVEHQYEIDVDEDSLNKAIFYLMGEFHVDMGPLEQMAKEKSIAVLKDKLENLI